MSITVLAAVAKLLREPGKEPEIPEPDTSIDFMPPPMQPEAPQVETRPWRRKSTKRPAQRPR